MFKFVGETLNKKSKVMTAIEFNYKLTSLQDYLKYFALKLTSNEDDAQDLLQETYVKALTNREKFSYQTNMKAWLYTIMKNIFINNYRRNKRSNTFLDSTEDMYFLNNTVEERNANPETILAAKELKSEIRNLDQDYRRAFEMFNEGYKYKEIAEELDLSIGTVKSRIFFIRKKLSENLKAYSVN
ncbi:MAG: sigma-70 family RNA polymerase sigma factor [Bacteroidales bacterium]|nr:sigma-70 family RNA polymerase sigma factor [Bacteroidales bacterium]MCF8399210.1 sigma-70 family RNA polymerase sigma factor [Bacteroidales bacterium]